MLITLEVTPDIAAKIRFMAESGVFALDTGNASLNFLKGELKSIKTERFTYPQHLSTPVDNVEIDTLSKESIL